MVREVSQDMFCIEVPLPGSPLKYLNSYVIRTQERSLIIDTGFNCSACLDAMLNGLNALGIDRRDADIFITHFHADHFSLIPELKTPTTCIYFNRPEAELLENWKGFGAMLSNADRHGFPDDCLQAALEAHPGSKFGVEWSPGATMLSEGQRLTYGDHTFTCLETPGHTLGHICLYEENRKLLVSGDHVLVDITPNIQCWTDHDNPLKHYISSLEKVGGLDVSLVLPGHRRSFTDLASRSRELIAHHMDRLDEIRGILDKGPGTAYETASRMTWDILASDWENFPIAQKWFATGEALSHLRYLEERKEIHRLAGKRHVRFAHGPSDDSGV